MSSTHKYYKKNASEICERMAKRYRTDSSYRNAAIERATKRTKSDTNRQARVRTAKKSIAKAFKRLMENILA